MRNHILAPLYVIFLLFLIPYIYTRYVIIEYNYWFFANATTGLGLYAFYLSPIVLVLFAKKSINKPSDLLSWLYLILVCIPTVSLSPYLANSLVNGAIVNFIVSGVTFILILIGYINEKVVVPNFKGLSDSLMFVLIYLLIAALTFTLIINYNFNISKVLDLSIFSDTYLIRDEFRNTKNSVSIIASYSIYWLAKVLIPFLICYGLAFKRKTPILIGILLQLVIFSVSAHKSFIFSILLIFAIFIFIKRKYTIYHWVASTFVITLGSIIIFKLFSISVLIDVIIRRALIIPGVLSVWWVNYFSTHDYAYFGEGLLSKLYKNPSEINAANLIGQYYFGNSWTSANINFAIDAYGNGGWFILMIFIIILSVILLVINRFSSGSDEKKLFVTLFTVPIFWSLIETSFVSVLITHGLFLIIFIIMFFRKN